jgi:hypothetical protein
MQGGFSGALADASARVEFKKSRFVAIAAK